MPKPDRPLRRESDERQSDSDTERELAGCPRLWSIRARYWLFIPLPDWDHQRALTGQRRPLCACAHSSTAPHTLVCPERRLSARHTAAVISWACECECLSHAGSFLAAEAARLDADTRRIIALCASPTVRALVERHHAPTDVRSLQAYALSIYRCTFLFLPTDMCSYTYGKRADVDTQKERPGYLHIGSESRVSIHRSNAGEYSGCGAQDVRHLAHTSVAARRIPRCAGEPCLAPKPHTHARTRARTHARMHIHTQVRAHTHALPQLCGGSCSGPAG